MAARGWSPPGGSRAIRAVPSGTGGSDCCGRSDIGSLRARTPPYTAPCVTPADFANHGPMSGYDGLKLDVDLVRTLREEDVHV